MFSGLTLSEALKAGRVNTAYLGGWDRTSWSGYGTLCRHVYIWGWWGRTLNRGTAAGDGGFSVGRRQSLLTLNLKGGSEALFGSEKEPQGC